MFNQDQGPEPTKTFTIAVDVRNSQGKPTGQRKEYSTNSSYKLWVFYSKYVNNTKISKKTIKNPTDDEAIKILKTMYNDN